mmetsp:Transcript_112080/g.317071  ORF Transcript_112080/g.317071 Transcript_112080/m.317071 type:complete len:130 (+) Transcript_112080:54-443(+)
MAHSPLARLCVLAALACAALHCGCAFLAAAPARRGEAAAVVAAGAAAAAALPGAAGAFYYDGKEYFDIFFGIDPLYWAVTAFGIVAYGAILKNAALKYNKPFGTTTIAAPKPPKAGKFLGQDIEQQGQS